MQETVSRVSVNERQGPTELGEVTAIRIEQSLIGAGRTLKLVQQPVNAALLALPTAKRSPAALADAQELLVRLVASNEDIESLRLVDAGGRVVVASRRDDIGLDVSAQTFFQRGLMVEVAGAQDVPKVPKVPLTIRLGTANPADGFGITLSQPVWNAKKIQCSVLQSPTSS